MFDFFFIMAMQSIFVGNMSLDTIWNWLIWALKIHGGLYPNPNQYPFQHLSLGFEIETLAWVWIIQIHLSKWTIKELLIY